MKAIGQMGDRYRYPAAAEDKSNRDPSPGAFL